ncbi:MAG TPA: type II secretion system protein [Candidatus Udaeobacter sp.]|nr:type II secretion system protein [Candidatus Udaeobacter sp.]
MTNKVLPGSCRPGVCVKRLTNCGNRRCDAFTLIELILVFGIILVLAGLILSTAGYARKKAARARAETEIAAISAACENYKADNGVYPRDNATNQYTDTLDARQYFDATQAVYNNASFYLYTQLSGDTTGNRNPTGKIYMTFKPNMLLPPGGNGTVTAISDPFGNSYGYSTANQADPATPKGYNPTFDLWSTAGGTTTDDTPKWIKNW